MIAGPNSGISGHQGGSMGESWSDLLAAEYLVQNGLRAPGQSPFVIGAYVTGNTISGIRIAGRGDAPIGTGIAVGGNNVLVEDVAIDGDVDVGVSVRSGEARLVASRFTDVRGVPVTIAAGARPALRQNLFVRDGEERGPAVHVQGDARPTIVDNTFVGYQEPVGGPQEVRDRAAADNYRVHGPAHAPVPLPAPQRRTP
jgi:hypothetical protein